MTSCAGDGSISFDEFRELMRRYDQTTTAAAVAKQHAASCDYEPSVENPLLSVSPRDAALTSPTGRHAVRDDDELGDAFHVFDKDRDGFLSATDLRSVHNNHFT